MVLELLIGFTLYVRAGDRRSLESQLAEATLTADSLKTELASLLRDAALVDRSRGLAERLRAKHCWSRLLAGLSQATPDGVMLSGLSTTPSKWARPRAQAGTVRSGHEPNGRGEPMDAPEKASTIEGLSIQGYAMHHEDLSRLMTGLRSAGLFSMIDLKGLERTEVQGREAIAFQLRVHW